MPKVLIVDDSPIDRTLVEGVLKKDSRMSIATAVNGADALGRLPDLLPDVVVTDLQMPELDGLQLVTAMRIHYPRIPVVLITAHGSEALAVQALEQGAASYVPKSQLAANLRESVGQVLALASADRGYESLAQCMDYAEFRFTSDNDFSTTERLVELVQQIVVSMGLCDTGGQVRLGMALEEAFRMSILRGNLELSSEELLDVSLQNDDQREWLQERRRQPRYAERKVRVHLQLSPVEARIEIAHDGEPLLLGANLESESCPELENPGDRSLILMRAFMDEVTFGADGRSVTMVKRQSS